jgi:cell wall-associated NlpC family hydrolase
VTALDKRLHAYRDDLADDRLKGRVAAARFVRGQGAVVVAPLAPVMREPRADAMQISQALFGEVVQVFEDQHGWSWVQLRGDHYVGYVASEHLTRDSSAATHRVAVPLTHRYPKPDLKMQPATALPMGASLSVTSQSGDYLALAGGGFVFAPHVMPFDSRQTDFVSVAEQFLHTPYLWGGKSCLGIDCSGLVQVALVAAGFPCPRDSDMQERELGVKLSPDTPLRRGDLAFWKGHVGIMRDAETLLHANGHHMMTVLEPFNVARDRIAAKGSPVTSIKRLSR